MWMPTDCLARRRFAGVLMSHICYKTAIGLDAKHTPAYQARQGPQARKDYRVRRCLQQAIALALVRLVAMTR